MNTKHQTSKRQRPLMFVAMAIGGIVALGAVALVAGKGGGGYPAAANSMAGMTMDSGKSAGTGTPVATDAVDIKNFGFAPATITVSAGSTVVWTNDDAVQHDITFDSGGIASGVLNHSDTFSHTFSTAGTYHYICSIHPFMHGTVIVTEGGSNHAIANSGNGY